MRRLLILRPEPGASATAEGARLLGIDPIVRPLFTIEPIAWSPPDPARFDALLITSANALRHGGERLATLAGLPIVAVGAATAEAARMAGFEVAAIGTAGASALLDLLPGRQSLLHLAGEDRADTHGRHSIHAITVYRAASITNPDLPDLSEMVIAVHSTRAGLRLAELAGDRSSTVVVAISEAAAAACGSGWPAVEWAREPGDSALLALAARLCQSPVR